ncbi:hypothetical protein CEUSTIGMA_g2465.t1 [Chlamydomonas eustigma]|uniref:Uncharacterized protein n=1 Tax=Chlamydomonas eustigma TaxID=1157962 RepID=A0A250WWD6_9CHLO|nr:hypothetical protein CEUSTIGMA_g2465.t1 [Chlamydomonas eustigma]|eukprot:GAX75019.1 hypothetical protein CEUSTIGMA_g2465.t1 [Chlamydomonas eustigma]
MMQRTGQTTELGDLKPIGRRPDQNEGDSNAGSGTGEGGPGAGSSGAGNQSNSTGSGSEHVDPRSEAYMPDQTGYYAGMGALVGAVFGWSTQFF